MLKPLVIYHLNEMKRPLIIFYGIVYLILIFMVVSTNNINGQGGNSSIGGMESASIIFIGIAGMNSFKETFHFFIAGNKTRKSMFLSFMITVPIVALLMALVDSVNILVLTNITRYAPMFYQIYGQAFGSAGGMAAFSVNNTAWYAVTSFLWFFATYGLFTMIGYFITILYYRMNKQQALVVSVGVPVILFTILPTIDSYLFGGRVFRAIFEGIKIFLGLNGTVSPYLAILNSLLLAGVIGSICYLMIRRVPLKQG